MPHPSGLMATVADLFFAGSDTVNYMLKWVIFLFAKYPEVAQKLQNEIDSVVPRGQLVSLTDKPR